MELKCVVVHLCSCCWWLVRFRWCFIGICRGIKSVQNSIRMEIMQWPPWVFQWLVTRMDVLVNIVSHNLITAPCDWIVIGNIYPAIFEFIPCTCIGVKGTWSSNSLLVAIYTYIIMLIYRLQLQLVFHHDQWTPPSLTMVTWVAILVTKSSLRQLLVLLTLTSQLSLRMVCRKAVVPLKIAMQSYQNQVAIRTTDTWGQHWTADRNLESHLKNHVCIQRQHFWWAIPANINIDHNVYIWIIHKLIIITCMYIHEHKQIIWNMQELGKCKNYLWS